MGRPGAAVSSSGNAVRRGDGKQRGKWGNRAPARPWLRGLSDAKCAGMPSLAPERRGLPFRRLALLCAALLSCTTVRTPVSTIEPEVALHGGRAEPQLELWVESNRPLTPAEAEKFRGEARAALETALDGRSQPDGDELVVIRAQGVARTGGHKGDQTAATAGIVVGAVVIVAAVVVAIVAGGKSSSGSHAPRGPSASAPRFGGSSIARANRVHVPARVAGGAASAARFRSVPAPRIPVRQLPTVAAPGRFPTAPAPRRFPVAPAPGAPSWPAPRPYAGPAIDIEVGFWWMIPIEDPEAIATYELPPAPPPEGEPADEGGAADGQPSPGDEAQSEEIPQAIPPEADQLTLPPPDGFPIGDRGFFSGDQLVLEALVLDRTSGEALRVKRVSRKVDPRDARAVKDAMDALLSDGGWQPAAAY